MISPTSPLCTPSGLIAMLEVRQHLILVIKSYNVCSLDAMIDALTWMELLLVEDLFCVLTLYPTITI